MKSTDKTEIPDEPLVIVQQRQNFKSIWVRFDKVGFHRYPQAPDEVAYLRNEHRHLFQFTVHIDVKHDDREIEFHMFKNWLTSLYEGGDLKVDHKSCEMLAQDLIEAINAKYDCRTRTISVDVSEDGECGATVVSEPGKTMTMSEYEIIRVHDSVQAHRKARKGVKQ